MVSAARTCALSVGCGVVFFGMAVPGASAAAPITFAAGQAVSIGSPDVAQGIATGDIDGDGYVDIATTSGASNAVAVVFGAGDGEFSAPVTVSIGSQARSVSLGDMDNDGYLDIVTANVSTDVSVALALPGRDFAPSQTFQSANFQQDLALGDLNGDGYLDIVTVTKYSQNLAVVLLADGEGGFDEAVSYSASEDPSAVALGDFNNDGDLDIAVSTTSSSMIDIMLGNGDGTFAAAQAFSAGGAINELALGDLNNDGDLDVVTAGDDGTVGVMLGNGQGELVVSSATLTGAPVVDVATADFNGDGDLDAAATNRTIANTAILAGDGTGTLTPTTTTDMTAEPLALATGDLNADGRVDVATVNTGTVNVGVAFNTTTYTPKNTVAPNTGPAAGGTSVTITGANFTGATSVTFGSADATEMRVVSDSKITAKTPPGAAGPVKVTVATPLVSVATANAFTYIAPAGQPQTLPPGTIPKKLRNSGKTLVNPAKSRTTQDEPVTAKVRARLRSGAAVRGDMFCLRTIKGPNRKLTVKLSGKCAMRVTVTYTAPGNATDAPFTFTKVYKTKRVR